MKWILIVAGITAACTAVTILRTWACRNRKKAKREISLMATVQSVMENAQGVMVGVFAAQGQELRFALPAAIARELYVGQKGVLTYRGGEFVYFVPRTEGGSNQYRAA